MPYVKQIVAHIDAALKATAFADARFAGSRFAGAVQQVPIRIDSDNRMIIVPATKTNAGEVTPVLPDDRFPLTTYHRLVSLTGAPAPKNQQFGSNNDTVTRTCEMVLVVSGFTNKLNLDALDLEGMIDAAFPTALDKGVQTALGLQRCDIAYGGARFESWKVYNEEYIGDGVLLKPHQLLLACRYKIESSYRKRCFNPCGCNEPNPS